MMTPSNRESNLSYSLGKSSMPDPFPLQDLESVVGELYSSFQVAYIVIAQESACVVWARPGAETLLPALESNLQSKSLFDIYPEFKSVVKDSKSEYGTHIGSAASELPTSIVINGKPYQCQQALIRNNLIGLMLNSSTDMFSQFSKYMADREQLFTTSRTISVSEMATTLAHEINQPVGSITNILKGLKARLARTESIPDEYVTAIDRALEQTSFAARIVSRIRDFTSSRQPNRVDCDVHKLLQESIQLLDWVLMNARVKVKLAPADQVIWVNADPTMLQQVFTNLIRNAVDSMSESAGAQNELEIQAFLEGDDVQIEITDNGHGLSDAAQDNIFVPFVTQKTQGMGVGLNICRSFVELHQGKLWLMPNDTGGCTASVLLPARERSSDSAG